MSHQSDNNPNQTLDELVNNQEEDKPETPKSNKSEVEEYGEIGVNEKRWRDDSEEGTDNKKFKSATESQTRDNTFIGVDFKTPSKTSLEDIMVNTTNITEEKKRNIIETLKYINAIREQQSTIEELVKDEEAAKKIVKHYEDKTVKELQEQTKGFTRRINVDPVNPEAEIVKDQYRCIMFWDLDDETTPAQVVDIILNYCDIALDIEPDMSVTRKDMNAVILAIDKGQREKIDAVLETKSIPGLGSPKEIKYRDLENAWRLVIAKIPMGISRADLLRELAQVVDILALALLAPKSIRDKELMIANVYLKTKEDAEKLYSKGFIRIKSINGWMSLPISAAREGVFDLRYIQLQLSPVPLEEHPMNIKKHVREELGVSPICTFNFKELESGKRRVQWAIIMNRSELIQALKKRSNNKTDLENVLTLKKVQFNKTNATFTL